MDTGQETKHLPRPIAVVHTLDSFRDPWDFALLVECFYGVRRFDDFVQSMGISRNVLSKRLKALVGQGVLTKVVYQTKPDRFEYRLTEKGRGLYPIFMAILRWGERWLPGAHRDGWQLTHVLCGEACHPETVCDRCYEPITVRDVRVIPVAT